VLGEAVATFGLLLTIFGCIGAGNERDIPLAVALFITAGSVPPPAGWRRLAGRRPPTPPGVTLHDV
jgi:hypothetical protein